MWRRLVVPGSHGYVLALPEQRLGMGSKYSIGEKALLEGEERLRDQSPAEPRVQHSLLEYCFTFDTRNLHGIIASLRSEAVLK